MRHTRLGLQAALVCLAAGMAAEAGAETMAFYRNVTAELPVAFEYPIGWSAEFSRGSVEAYHQVQVYAPDAVESRLRAYLVVRRLAAGSGPEALAASYRKTLQPGWQVDGESRETVLGQPAIRLRVSGSLLLPWNSPKAQLVPIQGERVFVQTSNGLFELGWLATPTASPVVSAAFAHLMKTLAVL